jgi:hypothetical protein
VVTVDPLTTTDLTPRLTGTSDDASTVVRVTVAGNTYRAANNGDGTWMLADDTISPALAVGTHNVVVTATDLAGNVGTDGTTDELKIERTTPPQPVLVNNLVKVNRGSMVFDRRTGRYSVEITIRNTSQTSIQGPAHLVVDKISDPAVTLANSDGVTAAGLPYLDLSSKLGDGRLDPGEVLKVRLYFSNPLRKRFTFELFMFGVV